MKPSSVVFTFASTAALLCAGCATPKPVLDLADKTAGNVALLNTSITAFAANQQAVMNQRLSLDGALADQYAELAARNQLLVDSMRLAGNTDGLSLILGIIAASESETTNQAQVLQVSANQVKLMSAGQLQLTTYSDKLKTLSDSLSQLAKDDDMQTRLMNLAVYAQQVSASIEAARTNHAASASTNNHATLAHQTSEKAKIVQQKLVKQQPKQ